MPEEKKVHREFPLYPLLNEINAAAQGGAPFIALSMCVTLPDICASLISEDGRTSGVKYKEWCRDNLGQEFSYLSPDDLYSMRCGVVHNGRFGDLQHNVARVIFMLPGGVAMTNCVINDAYIYSVKEFCLNFTRAVFNWIEDNRDDATLQSNAERLMQYRHGGLAPYIVGSTVLA